MAKGSQLSQLKSALSQAGFSGNSQASKKRKRSAVPLKKDKETRVASLAEIHRRLNPFDVKVTKTKHDIGGRKVKGLTGKPARSKQAGLEQRKKTLLKEWEERNRAGGIVDRRFGENDPTMSLEERMLERFTRERQRASKGIAFNLGDEDELTHYGQSLSKQDDFDDFALELESENDYLDEDDVSQTHFGGFHGDEGEFENDIDEPMRKKSKAEVMAEVIVKSKEHKLRRQLEKEQEESVRHELDNDFAVLRDLLYAPDPILADANAITFGKSQRQGDDPPDTDANKSSSLYEVQDVNYDQHVRELAFDKRSKPKDRTKTEEELALEKKEALEKAEKQRQNRMLGLEDSGSEYEGNVRGKRKRGGDDLEDDFYNDEGNEWGGLGTGLDATATVEDEEDVWGEEDGSHEDESDDEDDEGEEGDGLHGVNESGSEYEEGEQEDSITIAPKEKENLSPSAHKELPYTFPAPANHEEFLDIVENIEDKDIPIVIQRIRTLYHTSLAPENKSRLQALASVLIDHILYVTALPNPRLSLVSSLFPHLVAITKAYPTPAAQLFKDKLCLMHKNLSRGLSRGATSSEAKTWPGTSELCLLRVIGMLWPTSDLNHAVISPARILMASYLGLCRIRSLRDIAGGLFLCTLFLQYESLSRRLVPETINFLVNTFLHLSPMGFKGITLLTGSFPAPDFRSDLCRELHLNSSKKTPKPGKSNFVDLLTLKEPNEQVKVDLLALTLDLFGKFGEAYKGLDGFVEVYGPVLNILQHAETKNWDRCLTLRHSKAVDMISRLVKFAEQSRRPLALQAHKPIPIPSYVPKFQYTTSNHLRNKDPDHERNEVIKLRYQLKKEKKGAIRELRKDARFLAAVEQKRQLDKDKDYDEKLRKAYASIESERAEQKAMEREKAREKRRAGKK